MKTISVKEARAAYGLDIDEKKLAQGPLFIERGGRRLAAVISATDYDAFHVWQEARERERRPREDMEAFEQERAAYERLEPDLLERYSGLYVAVRGGQVVDSDADEMTLLQRVYDRFGYCVVYIRQVGAPLPVRRISSPRVVRR